MWRGAKSRQLPLTFLQTSFIQPSLPAPNVFAIQESAQYNIQAAENAGKLIHALPITPNCHICNWEWTDELYHGRRTMKTGMSSILSGMELRLLGVPNCWARPHHPCLFPRISMSMALRRQFSYANRMWQCSTKFGNRQCHRTMPRGLS